MTPEEMQELIDALANGNASEFAQMMGVRYSTVVRWRAGLSATPGPVALLYAAYRVHRGTGQERHLPRLLREAARRLGRLPGE